MSNRIVNTNQPVNDARYRQNLDYAFADWKCTQCAYKGKKVVRVGSGEQLRHTCPWCGGDVKKEVSGE